MRPQLPEPKPKSFWEQIEDVLDDMYGRVWRLALLIVVVSIPLGIALAFCVTSWRTPRLTSTPHDLWPPTLSASNANPAPLPIGVLDKIYDDRTQNSLNPQKDPTRKSSVSPAGSALRQAQDAPSESRGALTVVRRWGIRTLGELAALPSAGLLSRLGQEAVRWREVAVEIRSQREQQFLDLLQPGFGILLREAGKLAAQCDEIVLARQHQLILLHLDHCDILLAGEDFQFRHGQ